MNVADFLTDTAARIPDHPAVLFEKRTLTYGEMNRKVDCLARGLRRAGLRRGDFCVLMMPSSLNWALIYYALAKLGAVVVPVNFLYRQRELEYILNDCRPSVFFGHADYLREALLAMESVPRMNLRIGEGDFLPEGFISLLDLFEDERPLENNSAREDDPFAIAYTSGTTGQPKGAVLTHRNLMSDARAVAAVRHAEPDDIVLSVLPLSRVYGQTHCLNTSIYLGLTMRMWDTFDAQAVLSAIEEEESTILYAVPTIVNRLTMVATHNPPGRSSLRFCVCGADSLSIEVLRRFEKIFETKIYETYGLTECSPVCVESPYGQPTRPGSIGFPLPGFLVRIVDDETRDVPRGQIGELIVQGPAVMKEYLNQPEATAEVLRGGWLHTGDLARMDEDGYLFIVDRKQDLIIRGGNNVYPREIEEILNEHQDVIESAVIGVPHPDLGQEVAAHVVLKPGSRISAEKLQRYLKARVAPYKYPRIIKFVSELPKTSVGKIYKGGVR
jgi:long-chain acyl-CoA synthetase